MRSHTKCLAAVLLLCFALVSGPGAWALSVHGPVPVPRQDSSLIDKLREWVGSLLVKAGIPPAPEPPPQTKEGPQMDPNGGH